MLWVGLLVEARDEWSSMEREMWISRNSGVEEDGCASVGMLAIVFLHAK